MDARGTVENDERHNRGASAAAAGRAAIERGQQGATTLRRATLAARLLISTGRFGFGPRFRHRHLCLFFSHGLLEPAYDGQTKFEKRQAPSSSTERAQST